MLLIIRIFILKNKYKNTCNIISITKFNWQEKNSVKSKHWIVLAASITRARWHRDLMVNVSCGHRYDHVSDVTEQRWLTLTFYEKIDSYMCDQICILSFTLFSMLHAIFYVNANRLNYTKKFNSLQKWLKNDAHHFNSKKIITDFIETASIFTDGQQQFFLTHTYMVPVKTF